MSKWLAQARAGVSEAIRVPSVASGPIDSTDRLRSRETPHERRVPLVPLVSLAPSARPNGTNGTNGTAPQIEIGEIEERIAMALEGGVPAPYAPAFARMQVGRPAGMAEAQWQRAIDAAGRFLDAHGPAAAALGWSADDLFSPGGLVGALGAADVTCLSSSAAMLSDSRIVRGLHRDELHFSSQV